MMSRSVQLVRRVLSTVLLVSIAAPTLAQQNADTTRRTAPQTDLPLIPTRPLKFTTDEGTWMSLDVSQDGKTIVFDLLGDIYTVPIGGGSAKRITSGSGFDGQPRFSPDGKSIVFVSDRSGSENLYLVDPEGQRVRPLTTGRNQAYVSPDFTPDGQYIVVSRSNDLWLYHKDGGSGLRLTGQTQQPQQQGGPGGGNQPNNFMGASVAPDGRYIYASARTGPAGYNQMLGSTQIVMYDRNTGRLERRTLNLGTGFRPAVSPDGKWLAYGSRRMAVTGLKLRELASGDEKWLATDIQRDDIESRGSRDLLPGYSWTPDSKALVLTRQGKIWRVDAATGQQSPIPFTAEVDQMLADLVRFEYPVNDSTLTVRQIRGARPSPNGKRLVFSALDRLWAMDLPGCPPAQACSPTAGVSTAKRLTTSDEGEHSPVWSPDGKYIAYVSWTEDGGDIWRIPAAGGKPEKLTKASAFYDEIAYSPNGARIVAVRAPREQRAEINDEINPKLVITDLVWIPAAGGQATLISPLTNAERPHFSNDSTRVWVYDDEDGLVSMRWDGTDRKAHLIVTGFQTPGAGPNARPRRATQLQVSPDGMRVLAQVDNKLYVVPLPVTGGQTPTVSVEQPNNSAIPFRRLSRIGGDFLGWNADSKGLFYSMGRAFFQYDLARADSLAADSTAKAPARPPRPDSTPNAAPAARGKPVYEPVRTDVAITVPKDRPSGTVVLRGARIITMKGDEVIPRGDIVVTNNRIVAVGAEGSVTVPAGARTIDASGKTIMPGLVDVHAHMWPQWGVHSPQPYMYTVNLAYGVTTTRDPQTSQADVVSYGDAVDVGQMIGPRVLATGPGIFAYDNVTSADDAKEVMKRYSEFYLTETIKQYMAGDRRQRQWIAMAAKEQRITPTLEGGLDFKKNMTEAMDGYAGIEHTLPIAPMYKDAIEMFAKSGTTWTPTLLVQYGGPWAENWWYEHYDILNDPKLTHFTPFLELERRALRRPQWFRDSEYSFKLFAEQAKKLVEAGGRVGLGGHGQLQGLGVHWELWNIGSGGMKPIDVLRVGTIYGAESIGLGKQIGTVEAGKLADLLVLDANPLDDIKNTNTIRYVMKNGRVYEGNTLNEIWPRQRPMPKQWWMTHDALTPPESGTGGTAQSPTTRR